MVSHHGVTKLKSSNLRGRRVRIHYSFINLVVCVCAHIRRSACWSCSSWSPCWSYSSRYCTSCSHLVRTLHVIMSRQTLFQDKHAVEYGLQPVLRLVGGVITTVQCLLCVLIEREKHEGPSVKRQRTKNTQLFQFPFRPEAYKNHHESQHHE